LNLPNTATKPRGLGALLSEHAEESSRRYLGLVDAWRHFHERAIMSPDFGTARGMTALREQAYGNARSFLHAEQVMIQEISHQIALQARRDALNDQSATVTADTLSERIAELLTSSLSDLENEITVQIERDIAFLVRSVRNAALEVETAATAQQISRVAAKVQFRMRDRGELKFYFKDRQNRKWPSQKFVRTVWRQHLLDTYNETVLATLADFGIDQAMVVAPGSNNDRVLVTVLPGSELPTYRELRDEIFHPNSEAYLAPVEED
jgi:hypothetical protein